MKKFVVSAVIMLCVCMAGSAFAVPQSQTVSTKQKVVLVDRNGDNRIDGVDIYDENGKVVKKGYDTNNDMVIDRCETYDQNTGLPIVTESDKAFELN